MSSDYQRAIGRQNEFWRNYYEDAWSWRADFMRDRMAAGETSPLRIINQLRSFERKNRLVSDNGQIRVEKRDFSDDALLPSGTPAFRAASVAGNFVNTSFYATVNLLEFLLDFIATQPAFDRIVELGCGFGRNLLELHYHGGPRVPYYGGELTHSGVEIAQNLADLDPDIQATFFAFDHLLPDLSDVPPDGNTLVFTVHSIEQVSSIGLNWFHCLASHFQRVTCVHLEPFGFQIKRSGDVSDHHRKWATGTGWNLDLGPKLQDAHTRGIICVDYMGAEVMPNPSDPINPTSLCVWRGGLDDRPTER